MWWTCGNWELKTWVLQRLLCLSELHSTFQVAVVDADISPGIWINVELCKCQLHVFFKLFKEQIKLTSLAESFWRSCFIICLCFKVVKIFLSSCLSVTVGISQITVYFGDWRKVTHFIHKLLVWVFWTFHIFSDQIIDSVDAPVQVQSLWFFLLHKRGHYGSCPPVFVIWANFSFNSCILWSRVG